jgi:hypothetical protein
MSTVTLGPPVSLKSSGNSSLAIDLRIWISFWEELALLHPPIATTLPVSNDPAMFR